MAERAEVFEDCAMTVVLVPMGSLDVASMTLQKRNLAAKNIRIRMLSDARACMLSIEY